MSDIENFLNNLFTLSDNIWSLHLCPTGGHVGLHCISLDFELLQTGAGTLDEIMIKATDLSDKLRVDSKPYIDTVNKIVPIQQQLRSSGDTLFFDQMLKIVNECRKFYGVEE